MLYKKVVATFCIFNSDVSVWLNFVFFLSILVKRVKTENWKLKNEKRKPAREREKRKKKKKFEIEYENEDQRNTKSAR